MGEARRKVTGEDIAKARRLRREMPLAEKVLWKQLRATPKECGATFRRQQPIHPYIADFACLKAKLIIELDGMSHDARQSHDAARDTYLRDLGYDVLRFANEDVLTDAEAVVRTILAHMRVEIL